MSIAIKGMNMPKNCNHCPFNILERYYSCILTRKSPNWGQSGRMSNCPLIEIPDEVDEIKIGDEVIIPTDDKLVVTAIRRGVVYGVNKYGTMTGGHITIAKKTGRHFPQIEEVMEQIEEWG